MTVSEIPRTTLITAFQSKAVVLQTQERAKYLWTKLAPFLNPDQQRALMDAWDTGLKSPERRSTMYLAVNKVLAAWKEENHYPWPIYPVVVTKEEPEPVPEKVEAKPKRRIVGR